MPIDTRERPRMAATAPACRAVVAARAARARARADAPAPPAGPPLLRRAARRAGDGAAAAADAGLDPAEIDGWLADRDVEEALDGDMAARARADARRPGPRPQARQLVGRTPLHLPLLRDRPGSSDGVRIAVPGFQPFAVYDVDVANLVPGIDRREPPESAARCSPGRGRRWRPRRSRCSATSRARCPRGARPRRHEDCLGADGFWTLGGRPLNAPRTPGSSRACSTTTSAPRSASADTGPSRSRRRARRRRGHRRCRAACRR